MNFSHSYWNGSGEWEDPLPWWSQWRSQNCWWRCCRSHSQVGLRVAKHSPLAGHSRKLSPGSKTPTLSCRWTHCWEKTDSYLDPEAVGSRGSFWALRSSLRLPVFFLKADHRVLAKQCATQSSKHGGDLVDGCFLPLKLGLILASYPDVRPISLSRKSEGDMSWDTVGSDMTSSFAKATLGNRRRKEVWG